MPSLRTLHIVGVHAEGEVCDAVVGGFTEPKGCKTMYEKLCYFRDEADDIRQLLMQEPRGRSSQCMNMILQPCNPLADAGFLTMESDEYPPMSGANTIATATVLLETGMLAMKEPTTTLKLDTAAGLIEARAECEAGKCKNVAFDNVPAFVYVLDHQVEVPGVGTVSVDVAWGGMHYVLVDASSVGLKIDNAHGAELIRVGEAIKAAVRQSFVPVHPENSRIKESLRSLFRSSLMAPKSPQIPLSFRLADLIEALAALEHALGWQFFTLGASSKKGNSFGTGVSLAQNLSVTFEVQQKWESTML
ncbi:hypothetical protein PRZ48_002281 [Zasmidium cellare]|uniref:Proline racemase n=1 Tax=Zasmidium cellare TaxID=395010 RepID=A0ABR0F3K9_ZASCE|nr:hypothetical protein PRZ48_002281 [Zasmidium cellare]